MEHLLTREITSSIGRKTALGRSVLWPIIYANTHSDCPGMIPSPCALLRKGPW